MRKHCWCCFNGLAFDYIPHNLLIAKIYVYEFSRNTVTFFYSYIKRQNQIVRFNDTNGVFQVLLSRVNLGSVLDPLLIYK